MKKDKKTFNLEERLIDFAVQAISVARMLPRTKEGLHFANQLVRSGSSPALNYGEAQSAESRKDFLHKMKICLKELRESYICMHIIKKAFVIKNKQLLDTCIKECDELIAIFAASVKTASKKR